MLSHQLGWQVCQLKSWGAWIQCILAAWGKTFLEGRSKCNLVAARGPHYRLSRPRITQNCTRVLTTPAVFPICTNRKFPISYLLLDTEQIRLVPAHWAQLSWMYRSYPVNTRNSSRGHFGAWEHVLCIGEARNAGELPVLEAALHWKPMRLCGLLSQLPCQLRWDLSKVCSAQCLRDPSGSRFQWPSMEPCTEKHAAWTFFLSQTHFPLPSRAFLGCPPKLTTCTWISCLGVCTLVGGERVNSNKCSYVCHFIIVQKWMVAKEALQRLISKLVPGASRPHGSSSHPGLVISVWGLKEALILVVFTLWPLIDIRASIPNKWLLTTEEAESVEPSSESPYWWPVRMINTGVFSPHCLTDPWWDLPGATRDLFWPPPQSILLTPSS